MQHSNMGRTVAGRVAGGAWLGDPETKFLTGVIRRKQFSKLISLCDVVALLGGGTASLAAGHPLVCPASAQRDFRGRRREAGGHGGTALRGNLCLQIEWPYLPGWSTLYLLK